MRKKICKVMILGDSGVGKTSILEQYVNRIFTGKYKVTIGADFLTKDLTINEEKIMLQIWDTAGQEKYRGLSLAYYRGSEACVLVYDITNKASFTSLNSWMETFFGQVPESQLDNFPLVIVGNKIDKEGREVTLEVARKWTQLHNNATLVEVSAKTGIGIDTVFNHIGDLLANKYNGPAKIKGQKIISDLKPRDKGCCE